MASDTRFTPDLGRLSREDRSERTDSGGRSSNFDQDYLASQPSDTRGIRPEMHVENLSAPVFGAQDRSALDERTGTTLRSTGQRAIIDRGFDDEAHFDTRWGESYRLAPPEVPTQQMQQMRDENRSWDAQTSGYGDHDSRVRDRYGGSSMSYEDRGIQYYDQRSSQQQQQQQQQSQQQRHQDGKVSYGEYVAPKLWNSDLDKVPEKTRDRDEARRLSRDREDERIGYRARTSPQTQVQDDDDGFDDECGATPMATTSRGTFAEYAKDLSSRHQVPTLSPSYLDYSVSEPPLSELKQEGRAGAGTASYSRPSTASWDQNTRMTQHTMSTASPWEHSQDMDDDRNGDWDRNMQVSSSRSKEDFDRDPDDMDQRMFRTSQQPNVRSREEAFYISDVYPLSYAKDVRGPGQDAGRADTRTSSQDSRSSYTPFQQRAGGGYDRTPMRNQENMTTASQLGSGDVERDYWEPDRRRRSGSPFFPNRGQDQQQSQQQSQQQMMSQSSSGSAMSGRSASGGRSQNQAYGEPTTASSRDQMWSRDQSVLLGSTTPIGSNLTTASLDRDTSDDSRGSSSWGQASAPMSSSVGSDIRGSSYDVSSSQISQSGQRRDYDGADWGASSARLTQQPFDRDHYAGRHSRHRGGMMQPRASRRSFDIDDDSRVMRNQTASGAREDGRTFHEVRAMKASEMAWEGGREDVSTEADQARNMRLHRGTVVTHGGLDLHPRASKQSQHGKRVRVPSGSGRQNQSLSQSTSTEPSMARLATGSVESGIGQERPAAYQTESWDDQYEAASAWRGSSVTDEMRDDTAVAGQSQPLINAWLDGDDFAHSKAAAWPRHKKGDLVRMYGEEYDRDVTNRQKAERSWQKQERGARHGSSRQQGGNQESSTQTIAGYGQSVRDDYEDEGWRTGGYYQTSDGQRHEIIIQDPITRQEFEHARRLEERILRESRNNARLFRVYDVPSRQDQRRNALRRREYESEMGRSRTSLNPRAIRIDSALTRRLHTLRRRSIAALASAIFPYDPTKPDPERLNVANSDSQTNASKDRLMMMLLVSLGICTLATALSWDKEDSPGVFSRLKKEYEQLRRVLSSHLLQARCASCTEIVPPPVTPVAGVTAISDNVGPQDVRGYCEQLVSARAPVVMPSAEALAGIDFSSYRPGSLLGALFGGSDPVVFWNGDRSAFANLFLLPGAFIMLAMRVGALSCRTIANSVRIGTLLAAWVPLRLFATAHAQTYPPPSGIDADQDLNSRLGRVLDAYWAWAAYVISRCGVGFLNFARWCAEQDGLLPMSARRRFGELHELSTADHSWPEANETLRRSLGDDYWQVLYIPPVSQLSPMGDGAIEQTFAGAMLLPVEKDIRMDDSSRGGEVVHRQHVTEVLPIALRVRHRSLIRQMYQDLFFLRVLAAGRDLIGRIFPPALAQHISARRLLREFANETLLAVRYEDQAALVHRIGEHFSSHTSDDTSTEDELAKSGLEARIVDPDPQVMPLEVPRVILAHPLVTVTSLAKGIPLDRILALTPQGEDLLSDDEIAVGAHFSQSLLERIRNSGVEGIRKLKEAIARSIFAMTLRLTVYNGVYLSSFEPRSLLLHETDFDPKETSSKESKEEKANADALHTSLVAADFPHAARILSPQMHRKMIAALQCLYSGDSRGFAKALIDRHSEAYLKRSLSANSNLEASFILSLSPLLRLPADSSPAASKPGTVSRGYIPLPMALASVTQSARRSHIDLDPEIMAPLVALCRAQQLVAELAPQIDTCPKLAEAVQSAAFSLLPRRTNAVLQEPTNKHLRYT